MSLRSRMSKRSSPAKVRATLETFVQRPAMVGARCGSIFVRLRQKKLQAEYHGGSALLRISRSAALTCLGGGSNLSEGYVVNWKGLV